VDGQPDSGTPLYSNATLVISAPADDALTVIGSDPDFSVPLEFAVTGFTLKEPGTCGEDPDCGQVRVLVDGIACNDPQFPFNNLGIASPVSARLALCETPVGRHNLTLELRRDDGSIVRSRDGRYAMDMVEVTTVAGDDLPTLAITSPAPGTTILLPEDPAKGVALGFATTNLDLRGPGECDPADATCAFIVVNVDGNTCDDPNLPFPINNVAGPEGATALLGLCPTIPGAHVLTLTAIKGDNSPVMVGGRPLSASVEVMTFERPRLTITSPAEGASVALGAPPEGFVEIGFTAEHLDLRNPGECGDTPMCGFIGLNIDGNDCNNPNIPGPVNNIAISSPAAAAFGLCPVPPGTHTVSLIVVTDTMAPLMVDGEMVAASVTFTTTE
jgi:hypothetical protein